MLTPLLLLLPLACSAPTRLGPDGPALADGELIEGVSLSIDDTSYSAGDVATVRLVNGSPAPVSYNYCRSVRERWSGSEWVRIENLRLCTMHLDVLESGGEAVFEEEINIDWAPGRYRMVLPVHRGDADDPVYLATPPFDVAI